MKRLIFAGTAAAVVTGVLLGFQQSRGGARNGASDPTIGHRYGVEKPWAKAAGAIRLATYNTLNVFDDKDDPSLSGEHDDIKNVTSEDRLKHLAQAIRAVDADILALEEIESKEALLWFRDRFLKDMRYEHVSSIDVGYYRGVECAVLSRFPITAEKVWPDENLAAMKKEGLGWAKAPADAPKRYGYQRSPLMVNVRVRDDYELTILSLHHKAGRDFDWQRESEALRTVELVDEIRRQDPSRNIVVMGDFNAAPWDKSVRVYKAAGLIDVMDFRTTENSNPESRLYRTHESNRVLDYILLNSAAHREFVVGSAFVYGTLFPGEKYDYRKDTPPPGYASDHYPVVIDIMPRDLR
jgi:endonuclease/exonuclease/phosphatase family metal-dependent hydrolase